MHNNLKEILLLLGAAVLIVALFKRLRLSPVLGYLVAGSLIGPYGLEIVTDVKSTSYIAEFGVVFLLFYIGLELTFERLKTMHKLVFGFGTAQVILTSIIISGIAVYFFGLSRSAGVIIGGGLALSSTAIVMQVLAERGGTNTSQLGRLSISVLIAQDLAVVPLLVLVPLLVGEKTQISIALFTALLKAMVALVIILTLGRLLLRPLFRQIGTLKSEELFAATTLLIVLGSAWATQNAGLSLALGAFVAGLMVAETEFRHQVTANILPFKGLLLGLFFMSVGMAINLDFLVHNFLIVIALSIALIAIKASIIIFLCNVAKIRFSKALQAGLLLSQGSEFAFVLFGIADQTKVLPTNVSQILLIVVSTTMALTPLLFLLARRLAREIDGRAYLENKYTLEENIDAQNHVIIAGFGRMGQTIGKLLTLEETPYIALDTDPKKVYAGHLQGFPVYYGDSSMLDVLNSVGIKKASAIIVTTNNSAICRRIVETVRETFPAMPIIVRSKDLNGVKELEKAGATLVVPETYETSLRLGAATLHHIGVSDHEIDRLVHYFRSGHHGAKRRRKRI